jgi:TonB family protein
VPFVRAAGDGFQLLIPSAARAVVSTGGRKVEGGEVAKLAGASALDVPVKGTAYTIGLDDRVLVDIGPMRLIARYTRPQVAKTRPVGERIDVNFLSTLVILLLVAAAFVRMIAITDFGDLNLSDDLFKNKDRFAKYIAKAEQKEKPKFEKLSGVKEGAKPKDDEGKFGKKDAPQKEAAPSKKGAPVVDVNKREEDRKKVMNSGLIALLGGDTAGATSNVFGPGGIGTGLNNALGGINGAAGMGDANGVGGLGARGGGAGGGGTGLGIGGLGGHGSGRGRGGSGEFDLGGTGKTGTRFVPGKTTVVGGLTADEVGRIIRRHWNEIKYCYEKELSKDPNLSGKVAIAFVIDPVGDVGDARVSESTLNNGGAESCMLSNVKRWKFPAPRGGGTVEVNYPFIFQAQ